MPHIGNHVDAIFLPESVNTSTTLKINGGDLNVNNGQFFVDQSTTNVGIGTVTPETLLDIYGDGQDTAQISLRQWNDNSGAQPVDGPDIRFFCSGGTIASPVEPDTGDILGKVNAFVNTGSSYDQFGGFGWTYRTQGFGSSIDRGSSFAIETKSLYETANSAKIYISEEGNVGIGTAAPFRTFQINGSYNSSTSEYGAPNQWFINSLSSASAGTNLGSIVFSRSTGSTGASAKIQATATGTANETDLYFYNRTSGGADNVNNYLNTTPTLKLYHDKTAEFAGNVNLPDDAKLLLGTDDDFQIYYDGGTAHIDNNQGQIRMRAASSFLFYYEGSGGSEDYAKFLHNGAVELYHNNNKAFETTSTGIDVPLGTITGPATLNIDPAAVGDNTGTVVIKGNLQVDGTTTTINSTTLTVDDKNIVLASGAANAAAADGAGITVDGANATLIYNSTPDAWSFNKNVGIGTDSPATILHAVGKITAGPAGQTEITSANYLGTQITSSFHGYSQGNNGSSLALTNARSNSQGIPNVILNKANGDLTTPTAIGSSQAIGSVVFNGYDGTNYVNAAGIRAYTDGTIGTGNMPGHLSFWTSPAGSATPSERLRITSSGQVSIAADLTQSTDAKLTVEGSAALTNLDQTLMVRDGNTDDAVGNGGFIGLAGFVNNVPRTLAGIRGLKSSSGNNFNGDLAFYTRQNGVADLDEKLRITSEGKVLINQNSVNTYVDGAGYSQTPLLQVVTNSNTDSAISLRYNSGAGASGRRASFIFARTADGTAVSNNSVLGEVLFMGEGNSTLEKAASIRAEVDGTPGTNDMPGRLIFSTSSDGSDSPSERLRITSAGEVGIGVDNPNSNLHVKGGSESTDNLLLTLQSNGVANDGSLSTGLRLINSASDTSIHGADIRAIRTSSSTADLTFSLYNGSTPQDERLRITSAGDLLVNHDSSDGSGKLQVFTGSQDGIDILGFSNNATSGGRLTFYRSKSNTVGNFSEVADGDSLGRIDWRGYNDDGTTNNLGATIEALVSGAVNSTTDMPSDLVFKTSPDGSSSPSERLRIDAGGNVIIGASGTPATVGQTQLTLRSNSQVGLALLCGAIQNSTIYMGGLNDGYSPGDSGYSDGKILYNNSSNHMQFDTAGNERLRITSGGNVQLITSNAQLEWQAASGGDNPFIRSIGTNQEALEFNTGGSPRVRIGSGGNVGIGTDSPQGTVHISSGTSGDATLILEADTDNNNEADNPYIVFKQDGGVNASAIGHGVDSGVDANGLTIANSISSGFISFATGTTNGYTNATERVRITKDGNVGIGITDPSEKLEVAANAQHRIAIRATDTTMSNGADYGGYAFFSNDAANPNRKNWDIYQKASGSTGNTNLTIDSHSTSNVIKITSGGNVGLGIDSPTTRLHVHGTTSSGGILLEDSSATSQSPAITIIGKRSDANIHHSFSGKLFLAKNQTNSHIDDNDSILGTIAFGGNHTDGSMSNILYAAAIHGVAEEYFTMSGEGFSAADHMATGISFRTGTDGQTGFTNNQHIGTERVRIAHDGNVGIGSAAPKKKLDVSGTIKSSTVSYGNNQDGTYLIAGATSWSGTVNNWGTYGFQHKIKSNAGGTARITVDTINGEALCVVNDNKIGIGTNDPSSKLTIAGSSATARLELKRTNAAGGGSYGAINFTALDNHSVASIHVKGDGDGDDNGGDIIFRTTSAATTNDPYTNSERFRITSAGAITAGGNTVWHGGNDGSGSGLDADLLDGQEGSYYRNASNLNAGTVNKSRLPSSMNGTTFTGDLRVDNDADLRIGDGNANERILIQKADNNASDHIIFYNGTTRIGEIGCEDTTWLRINQETNKNIYTPRYIRADNGFFIDGTSYGIAGDAEVRAKGGSATDPGITFGNDTDTGIYRNGSNKISFCSNGVRRCDMSSGNFTFPGIYNNTTSSGSAVRVTSGGRLRRQSSSRKSKTNIEPMDYAYCNNILDNAEPIWYRPRIPDPEFPQEYLDWLAENYPDEQPEIGSCDDYCKNHNVDWEVGDKWMNEGENPNHSKWGFIAEDLALVDPRFCVQGDGEGEWVGINYDEFTPMLVRIAQEQRRQIRSLEQGLNNFSASKNFRIPHPLPELSETKDLVHVSIDAPAHDLIYRGKSELVNGSATINLDTESGMTEGTFVALCRNVQCFTSNESDWSAVRGSVSGNILTIECQDSSSTATISWMVIGERQDDKVKSLTTTDANGNLILEPNREP